MNLHKKCRKCHEFFPAKPMELKFFCDKEECQKYLTEYHFYTIKSNRYISMDYFDIYDLDRPILRDGIVISYERVCRQCGEPLFNKDGKYSYHRRYCQNHSGYDLWAKYNWGEVSKKYAKEKREENIELINEKCKDRNIEESNTLFVLCEECGNLCYIYDCYNYFKKKQGNKIDVANIHHIFPVHKITMKDIHLIWDYSNLKVLCKECHNKQDHQLKTKVDPLIHFRKITEFSNGV